MMKVALKNFENRRFGTPKLGGQVMLQFEQTPSISDTTIKQSSIKFISTTLLFGNFVSKALICIEINWSTGIVLKKAFCMRYVQTMAHLRRWHITMIQSFLYINIGAGSGELF